MIKTGSVASRFFVGVMAVGGAGSELDGAGRDLNGAGIGLNGAGAEVDGAGVELNGAGSILGLEPAPSKRRRRPIRGAGFAPVLEPAPIIVEPAPCTVRPAPSGVKAQRPGSKAENVLLRGEWLDVEFGV